MVNLYNIAINFLIFLNNYHCILLNYTLASQYLYLLHYLFEYYLCLMQSVNGAPFLNITPLFLFSFRFAASSVSFQEHHLLLLLVSGKKKIKKKKKIITVYKYSICQLNWIPCHFYIFNFKLVTKMMFTLSSISSSSKTILQYMKILNQILLKI